MRSRPRRAASLPVEPLAFGVHPGLPAEPLAERSARDLGTAIAVAAHSPAAIALLARLTLGRSAWMPDGWCGGGCHVFGLALERWLRDGEARLDRARRYVDLADPARPVRTEPVARRDLPPKETPKVRVLAAKAHLVHVVVAFRGWYFDDRGAWSEGDLLLAYAQFDVTLADYEPGRFLHERLPREPAHADALYELLCAQLGAWRQWATPAGPRVSHGRYHFHPGGGLLPDVDASQGRATLRPPAPSPDPAEALRAEVAALETVLEGVRPVAARQRR